MIMPGRDEPYLNTEIIIAVVNQTAVCKDAPEIVTSLARVGSVYQFIICGPMEIAENIDGFLD